MPELVLTERELEVMRGNSRVGALASVACHIGILAVVVVLATGRPFAPSAEAILVELVPASEIPTPVQKPAQTPEPAVKPDDAAKFALPAAPPPPAPPPPQQQPASQSKASQPKASQAKPSTDAGAAATQPVAASAAPSAPPTAAPDITEQYGVRLGLPDRPIGFDTAATEKADIATNFSSAFKSHLKTCSVLPGSIERADKVRIKLRVAFTSEGKLSGRPSVIEASASTKGPLLMQASIDALVACQPYTMLPADKYSEWRVLDLSFTPADFKGG